LSPAITCSIFGLASAPSRLSLRSTRYGHPNAAAALGAPARGLAALTGLSVEPGYSNYVMARRIRCWEAMDEITPPDVDQATIDGCRELLEDDGIGLSDEEVDRVLQHAEVVARVVIELFLQNRKTH
jgi:hypothetical protein